MKYRVTKYNPDFRDRNNNYLVNEWTSYTDIGNLYNGKVFTKEAYEKTEAKYIDAIYTLLDLIKENKLKIKNLEKNNTKKDFLSSDLNELYKVYKILKEDMIVFDLREVIMLVLREYCWFELHSIDEKIKISFGYDYYMYFDIGDNNTLPEKEMKKTGLFIEKLID